MCFSVPVLGMVCIYYPGDMKCPDLDSKLHGPHSNLHLLKDEDWGSFLFQSWQHISSSKMFIFFSLYHCCSPAQRNS